MLDIQKTHYELNRSRAISEVIDDDAVVIDLESGCYFNMTGVSGYVWEKLMAGYSLDEIATAIDVDALGLEQISSQLSEFIEILLSKTLLLVRSAEPVDLPLLEKKHFSEFTLGVDEYTDMKEMLELDPIHDADEQVGWPKPKETANV